MPSATKQLNMRPLPVEEWDAANGAAKRAGMSLSAWVRQVMAAAASQSEQHGEGTQ